MTTVMSRTLYASSVQPLITAISLALLFFTLPLSSTAKSIFLVSSVILILTSNAFRQDIKAVFAYHWCKAALLLFFIALLACFWSPALLHEKCLVVEKYSKLLYLPILAIGFKDKKTRMLAINAFLLAMVITTLMSILKYWNVLTLAGADPGHVFRNHIMTGFMIAVAAYLSALFCLKSTGRRRLLYGFLTILFSYQIWFVNTGRTGYMIYLLVFFLFITQFLTWRQALSAFVLSSLLLAAVYHEHTGIQTRVGQVVDDLQHYQEDQKDTSVGYRLQFHAFAQKLFVQHPYLGNGTGSFTYLFSQLKPVPSWDRRLLEPHSFYWLVAVEFGILGIIVLFYFFASLVLAAYRLNTMQAIAIAMLIPFMVGNLSDSLLFYSGSGYFFIIFMALCFGERLERKL